ncbi:GspMb/PilO family protein [Microbacterium sp. Au-Mic1]|uniref:GspMb/PilO family protein n=1 Tax=Microbacterium sp. Au-Mic1 TaxID=2906457 RepID=UPI001E32B3A7|nr:GspMb/PilO family protein [Microbacterium sp. Au-Mic1]MCE4027660.1 GspMb/PilO family protein [Microbacterium sp. Au-Mic1]
MTKSLINLIGALVAAVIVVLAVVFGVLPLLGQAFSAFGDTAQAGVTNTAYESQITALQKEKARKSEIDAAVQDLRTQIPAVPDLDRAFDVIAGSAQASGVVITTIVREDLATYAPRTAPVPAGPGSAAAAKAKAAPQPTPQPTGPSGPVAQADNTAAQAGNAANQTSQAAGANGTGSASANASASPAVDTRQQIPLTVTATAADMSAVQTFLDGLRGSGRLLGVDKVEVQGGNGNLTVTLTLLAFVASDNSASGASK